jgi:hypothetical protein
LKATVILFSKAYVFYDKKEGRRNKHSKHPAGYYQSTGSSSLKTEGYWILGCTITLHGDHYEIQHGDGVQQTIGEKVYLTKCGPKLPVVVFRELVDMKCDQDRKDEI